MTELLKGIGPAAYVRDLAVSRRFYEKLLGLEIARVMSEDAKDIAVAYKGAVHLADRPRLRCHLRPILTAAGQARLRQLGIQFLKRPNWEPWPCGLEQTGVGFAQPLRELPWGQRAIRVYDPDGHIIDIGSPHRSLNC